MIDRIYIEDACREHPRVRRICACFPRATRVACEHYREVFNPRSQSFRLQKRRPALILAEKPEGFVLPTPAGYGVGGDRNYYFSHMLNCVYDCRYCFLQGMYSSAHYVVFVNFEDFQHAIREQAQRDAGCAPWFFSGYDCDSLALEPVTGFAAASLDLFRELPEARLEIRTKSTQIRCLRERDPLPNVVVAFSFTPPAISRRLEHKVPAVDKRIAALRMLADRGWPVGLRFDPVIYDPDYEAQYDGLFARIFEAVGPEAIHSATLGAFRMPKGFHERIARLYPDEPLYAMPMAGHHGQVSYPPAIEAGMLAYCRRRLGEYMAPDRLHGHGVYDESATPAV